MRRTIPPSGSALALTLALAGLLATGCQGREPASPPADPAATGTPGGASEVASGQIPLAMAELIVDPATGRADLIPLRVGSAVGDSYAVDATTFFVNSPCNDCMEIVGFGRDAAQDALRVDIRLRHPFPDRTRRRDLDVFDPRIIVVNPLDPARAPQTWTFTPGADTDGDGTPEPLAGNTQFLLNADGYTTHFDKRAEEVAGIALDGTLNPFINYYDAVSEVPFIRNANHRFRQDAEPETQPFLFYYPLGSTTLKTYLVLEVSYGESSTRSTRLIPTYFVPEFNMKEAYKVEVADLTNSLTSVAASTTTVQVSVADWQAPAPIADPYPNFNQPDWIRSASTATQVWMENPDLAPTAFTTVTTLSGTGAETNPLTFELTVSNASGVPAGTYPFLVTVRDSRDGFVQSLQGVSPSLGYTNDVRAYRIVYLTVHDPTTFKPIASLTNSTLLVQHGSPPYANAQAGRGDIAVYNGGLTSQGVLIPAATGDIVHYTLDYATASVYAPGRRPFDDYATDTPPRPHPSPTSNMPIQHIDAADDGSFAVSFSDDNFTFDPNGLPGSTLTRALPMSDFVAYTDNDSGVLFPGPRFIGGCGSDCLDPPACTQPAFGEKVLAVWESPALTGFTNPLGYATGGERTERCGIASLDYYVFGAPYTSTAQKQVSGNLNLWLDVTPATFFASMRAIDAGSVADGTSQKLYGLVGNEVYITDQLQGLNTSTRVAAPTSYDKKTILDPLVDIGLEAIDLQILERDRRVRRNMNGQGQTGDWLVVLYRDQGTGQGLLRIYDTDTFTRLQEIDGRGAGGSMVNFVTAVDVDDRDYTIHVAMDDNGTAAGGSYVVSVFSLQP